VLENGNMLKQTTNVSQIAKTFSDYFVVLEQQELYTDGNNTDRGENGWQQAAENQLFP
jgi:hypothetical protein